jgi:hypothetical protein
MVRNVRPRIGVTCSSVVVIAAGLLVLTFANDPAGGAAAPGAPAIGTATSGNGSATVTYAPGSDGGFAIVEYTAVCDSTNHGTPGAATRYEIAGPIVVSHLSNGKTYTCQVRTTNSQATSPPSAASNRVTIGVPGRAPTPQVSRIGAGHLKVSFAAAANRGARITRYRAVCRSSNGGVTRGRDGAASPLGVKRLTSGKTYACTLTATNSRGTGRASLTSKAVTA